ncbi:MAG: aromatic ring-hydroxylating dioxygenase subunit alpha [Acidobacteria bacterium]|nr:aromatic ring-hydroxylating dioxygenase subunit alpha [Acidobacteriota bacterium]
MVRSLESLIEGFDPSKPLAEAWTIPGTWYSDERIAELERKTVFSRNWQVVGRREMVAEPGQYITAEVGGEPVLVVCGQDGVVRGFFNVCRHHAAAVATEACGRAARLQCPYHGWTYGLDGSLKGVPDFDGVKDFERRENGLVPLAAAVWEKFVFVHLDPNPPSLDEYLGNMVDEFKPLKLAELHFAGRREWTIDCNWKVFVDNYLDGGYHVPYLHKSLNSVLSYANYTITCGGRYCLQSSPIEGNGEALTASVRKGQALYYWLYPNFMLNWYEGYLDTNLVLPLDIGKTRVIFEFYFNDVSQTAEPNNQKSMDISGRIQEEDQAICAAVQRGVKSRAYGSGRLSVRREAGENLFHKLLHADLSAGLISADSRVI